MCVFWLSTWAFTLHGSLYSSLWLVMTQIPLTTHTPTPHHSHPHPSTPYSVIPDVHSGHCYCVPHLWHSPSPEPHPLSSCGCPGLGEEEKSATSKGSGTSKKGNSSKAGKLVSGKRRWAVGPGFRKRGGGPLIQARVDWKGLINAHSAIKGRVIVHQKQCVCVCDCVCVCTYVRVCVHFQLYCTIGWWKRNTEPQC